MRSSKMRRLVESRTADLARAFDLTDALGRTVSDYSTGMTKKIMLAGAMIHSPRVLVLDEPTSALDGHSEALIRSTIAALHGRVTVVVIAHRMSTIDMCDRIMVVEDGRVTALGTPDALLASSAFYRRALTTAGILPREATDDQADADGSGRRTT